MKVILKFKWPPCPSKITTIIVLEGAALINKKKIP